MDVFTFWKSKTVEKFWEKNASNKEVEQRNGEVLINKKKEKRLEK